MNVSEAAEYLRKKDQILIVTHKNPDGDTLSSSAALCHALQTCGKTAFLFPNVQITRKYVPYVGKYFAPEGYTPKTIVSVDVADVSMFCQNFHEKVDLCIDHHPTNPGFGVENCIYPERAACGEIMTDIISCLPCGIDQEIATLLYIAITTDTGCFRYLNTTGNTFRCAALLYEKGADMATVNTVFFRKQSKARIAIEAEILSSMELYREGKIVFAFVTLDMIKRTGAKEEDLEDLSELAGRIDTELLGITIREKEDGGCKVSVRSFPEINSFEICRHFGGGGHKMAAGCTIPASPKEARDQLLKVIDEVWPF